MWSAVCVVFWALAESSSRWENACLRRGSHIVCVWLAPHCTVIDKAKFILRGGGFIWCSNNFNTEPLLFFLFGKLTQTAQCILRLTQLQFKATVHFFIAYIWLVKPGVCKEEHSSFCIYSTWCNKTWLSSHTNDQHVDFSRNIVHTNKQTNKHTVLWKFHLWSHFFIFFFKEVRFSWNVF